MPVNNPLRKLGFRLPCRNQVFLSKPYNATCVKAGSTSSCFKLRIRRIIRRFSCTCIATAPRTNKLPESSNLAALKGCFKTRSGLRLFENTR